MIDLAGARETVAGGGGGVWKGRRGRRRDGVVADDGQELKAGNITQII